MDFVAVYGVLKSLYHSYSLHIQCSQCVWSAVLCNYADQKIRVLFLIETLGCLQSYLADFSVVGFLEKEAKYS